jgi:hypothetical protein
MYKCDECGAVAKPGEPGCQVYLSKGKRIMCVRCYAEKGAALVQLERIEAKERWVRDYLSLLTKTLEWEFTFVKKFFFGDETLGEIMSDLSTKGKDYVISKLDHSDFSEEKKAVAKVAIFANMALQGEMDDWKALKEIQDAIYLCKNRTRKAKN